MGPLVGMWFTELLCSLHTTVKLEIGLCVLDRLTVLAAGICSMGLATSVKVFNQSLIVLSLNINIRIRIISSLISGCQDIYFVISGSLYLMDMGFVQQQVALMNVLEHYMKSRIEILFQSFVKRGKKGFMML